MCGYPGSLSVARRRAPTGSLQILKQAEFESDSGAAKFDAESGEREENPYATRHDAL